MKGKKKVDFSVRPRSAKEELPPSAEEWVALEFGWKVAKHVKSNAIVYARALEGLGQAISAGAGQMSRVDSVRLAVEKARPDSLESAALASDAFFPFSDGPQLAVEAGVSAIIQPGGSVRDHEVVEAVDKTGAAMVFTSRRHFRH